MKSNYLLFCLVVVYTLLFSSCKKKDESGSPVIRNITIDGAAQKGPFLTGSSITIYELDQNYTATGKTFSTEINDNSGSFQLVNIPLISNYVKVKAEGYYYNEVCGSNSISQITLNAIFDLGDTGAFNINLLTHLEKPRVEHLILSGLPLDSAKKIAQSEILNIFSITPLQLPNSEQLDISQPGDGNGILLAISSILQGHRTESELSSILSAISNDLLSDGTLDDISIQSSLIDHALLLDTIAIRNNLLGFYQSLGVNASIPSFNQYINQFVQNTNFQITNSVITYPTAGNYGENILLKSQVSFQGSFTSFTGQLKNCCVLKIRIHLLSGSRWYYNSSSTNNLTITSYDLATDEQFFTVIDPNMPFDLWMNFMSGGTYLIEYYEINSTIVSFSKTITVI